MLLLVLLFIVVPLAELYVIIEIGSAIGIVPTMAILFADSVIGAMLLRSQGRGAWVRFNRVLAEGRMPGREVFDGVVIIFGGALLLTPGFITDVVGLLFLLPPSRAAIRRAATRSVKRRMESGQVRVFGAGGSPFGPGGPFGGAGQGPGPAGPFGGAGAGEPGPFATRRVRPQPGDIDGSATEIRDEDRQLDQRPDGDEHATTEGGDGQ